MRPQDARKLLGGYATGTLTKTEREELMRAALEDPSLFEELVEEEDWRAALSAEPFRETLRRRLRKLLADSKHSWSERFSAVFRMKWITVLSATAALAVILLIRQGVVPESSPMANIVLGPGTVPALRAAGILEQPGEPEKRLASQSRTEPAPVAQGASIGLDRGGAEPHYRVGDRQRIGFQIPAKANVLLIEERPDGAAVRLFPNRFQSSPAVTPGVTVLVPPAGQGDLEVEGPAGRRTLRLLVFPPDVDPLTSNTSWAEIRGRARAIEKHYEVEP